MTESDGMVGDGREIQERGDICICVTDSLCGTAETNTILESNYTPIKKKNSTHGRYFFYR